MAVFGEIMTNMKKTYNHGEKVEGKKRAGSCPHQPRNMSPTTIAASTTHCHARGWWVWTIFLHGVWVLQYLSLPFLFLFFFFFLITLFFYLFFYTRQKSYSKSIHIRYFQIILFYHSKKLFYQLLHTILQYTQNLTFIFLFYLLK